MSRWDRGAALWFAALAWSCGGAPEADELERSEEALRLAGVTPVSPTTPWTHRPTVLAQVSHAATAATFTARQDAIQSADDSYYPSTLGSAYKSGDSARYTGTWHKDRRVSTWIWDKRIADADFGARRQELKDQGYEFFDYDVHVEGTTPYYDGIWLKRTGQREWASNRNLTDATLQTYIESRKADGFRPKRIEAYKLSGATKYIALWVKDGLTDFKWTTGKSAANLLTLHDQYAAQGYLLTDIAPYHNGSAVVYSGVWLKNAEVKADAYDSSMTEAEFREKNAEYMARNVVLVDLNVFYDTSGNLKYAAVWHRTETSNTLESNTTLTSSDKTSLNVAIDTFENDTTNVGSAGRFGLFVQNLTSGAWIGYNMNEPFYMASSTKLLLAAKVIDDGEASWDPTTLRAQDWRGEDDRGFLLSDFDDNGKPLETFLRNMLVGSDSASTDRLWGLVNDAAPGSLTDYLRADLGLQNVGELTTICELDKRIAAASDPCVHAVSCDTFEAWLRNDDGNYSATASEKACLAKLDADPDDGEHRPYYATNANSITPVEYGRALRAITYYALNDTQLEQFYRLTDAVDDDQYAPDMGVRYDSLSTKGGTKRKAKAQAGVMWDWQGEPNDYTQIAPRYSFAVFAESFSNANQQTYSPEPAMRSAVQVAVQLLENR